MFFEELGELSLFGSGEADGFADESCWGPGFQVDGVVLGPRWGEAFSFSLFEDVAIVAILEGHTVGSAWGLLWSSYYYASSCCCLSGEELGFGHVD